MNAYLSPREAAKKALQGYYARQRMCPPETEEEYFERQFTEDRTRTLEEYQRRTQERLGAPCGHILASMLAELRPKPKEMRLGDLNKPRHIRVDGVEWEYPRQYSPELLSSHKVMLYRKGELSCFSEDTLVTPEEK